MQAEINITPMIDVLLVLIIIFMVITPLTSTGLPTLVPQPPPPGREDQQPRLHDIVITVGKGSAVRINVERVDLSALPDRLAQIFRVHSDGVIFVRGEKDLEFRKIADVIDITKGAGFHSVALTVVD
ncbi:MAG: biopolymer transporter ExbD [Acidobacteriia bacterium]|nr:biopolymer transporter ExbD [Terriglobia bacterium]